jgi:hypothetical protein
VVTLLSFQGVDAAVTLPLPTNFVLTKTLVITPTRRIFRPEVLMLSCRLYRAFPEDKFVTVSFIDESLSKSFDSR